MNAKYPIVISIFSLGLITAAQGANFAVVKEQMLGADITVENYRSNRQENSSLNRVLESDVDAGHKNGADAGYYEGASTDELIQKVSYDKGKNKSFWSHRGKKGGLFWRSPFSF
ncbi:hypothetical protein [Bartonella bacilliformis]|uniref:hypothetical protein n=1 Tax=Bartonella bacilliformis TaxID=774 RepID=UPI0004A0ACD4|nr:hypothetical protein [Bartonella bacilliformis]KEG21576.1 hypothetical protein H703_01091 [Bartonella bacilliformis Ver075]